MLEGREYGADGMGGEFRKCGNEKKRRGANKSNIVKEESRKGYMHRRPVLPCKGEGVTGGKGPSRKGGKSNSR